MIGSMTRTVFAFLVPQRRPQGDDVVTVEVVTSARQDAVRVPVETLTSAAFSRIEKVLVAHDSETCDVDGCDQRVGLHLVARDEYEDEATYPFYVTPDGRALCEEHGEKQP